MAASLILWLLCPYILAQEAAPQISEPSLPLITQIVDEAQLTTLTGNTHPLARPEFDLGAAPATLPMDRMLMVLKRSPQQETALRKLLDDQQDKASPTYHKWLSPEQFGKQFGPTEADLQTVTLWLQSHGFEVSPTKGRTVLEFSGSASQVQQAFHTAIHKYIVKGEQHWANATDPQIPTALAPVVSGIDSLHNFLKPAMNVYAGTYSEKTKRLNAANPDYTVGCGSGSECYGLVPYDFAKIYDVLPLWNSGINGAGQTIAIVGRSNILAQDATTFWQLFGLSVPTNKLNIILNGPDPGITGDEGEADIDVEWSGAVAPQATIDLVTSQSTESTDGIDLSAVYIVDNNLAPVMSESYGECELGLGTAGNQFHYQLWEQAAAQGISVFVSSGDNGAANCDNPGGPAQYGLNVNGLASTPFNAAVGGTDFNQYKTWTTYWNATNDPTTQASAKGYIPETTWNDSCTNALAITLGFGTTAERACNNPNMISAGGVNSTGGSGGPSNCVVNNQTLGSCRQGYAKPSWQIAAGVPSDHLRDLPDVSLFASNGFMSSFYLVCQSDQTGGICDVNNFAGYGGTSVSSPAFAGIMSLVDQKVGAPQGVPGFALYKLAAQQPSAFHDIPSGSTIAMPCDGGTFYCMVSTPGDRFGVLSGYSTGPGYDLATGLGSVDAANLVNNWTSATFTATAATLSLNSGNPVTTAHGTPVTVSIGVSPTAASGNAALLVGTSSTNTGHAIDSFTLTNGATPAGTTTSLLPGGTYSVIAHYPGDGNYGGSYSTPVSVTVSKENSQTQAFLVTFDSSGNIISSNTNTAVYASPYLLRVNVENSAGHLCAPVSISAPTGCPSGTVTLTDNGNPLDGGTFTLNSYGYFEDQLVQLTGGSHSVAATYGGDISFNSSTISNAIKIIPAATTMSQPSIFNATVGQPATIYVSVNTTSPAAAPSGVVSFYANNKPITGTVSYIASTGVQGIAASLHATLGSDANMFPSPGTYSITATYSGDSNYNPSSSAANAITVKFPAPLVTFQPVSSSVAGGTPVTLTSVVMSSSKTVAPTGTISFQNSSGQIAGTVAYSTFTDQNGYLDLQGVLTINATFSDTFVAAYSGDANYPVATSNPGLITVTGNDFTLSFPQPSFTITRGSSSELNMFIGMQNSTSPVLFTATPCSGMPAETTCAANYSSVSITSMNLLNLSATAPHSALRQSALQKPPNWWIAPAVTLCCGVMLLGTVAPRRRRWATWAVLPLVMLLTMLPSCGGGGSGGGGGGGKGPTDPGTPAGSYPITVTATSGSGTAAITHTATFTLIVK